MANDTIQHDGNNPVPRPTAPHQPTTAQPLHQPHPTNRNSRRSDTTRHRFTTV